MFAFTREYDPRIKIAMVIGYTDLLVMIDGCKKEDLINRCFMIQHLPSGKQAQHSNMFANIECSYYQKVIK